jgi:DNA-binding NtrC family response regulator
MGKEARPERFKDVSILVADDDEGLRDMLFLLLSRLGYRVILAENGRQAFDLFTRGPVSLVLTDLCMPEMDGLTLAAMVKNASPQTPVILITGSLVQEGADMGCVDFMVAKPFQLDDIHRTVERALERAIYRPRARHGPEIHLQG